MTSFWSWYITLLTLGSLTALLWLIFATRRGESANGGDKTMGHAFDGIEEYDNPLPKWWFLLFIATIVFAAGYLALYPGLGNWKGVLPGYEDGWTQTKEWQREVDAAENLSRRTNRRVIVECVLLTLLGTPFYAWSWHVTDPDRAAIWTAAGFAVSYAGPFFRWLLHHTRTSDAFN